MQEQEFAVKVENISKVYDLRTAHRNFRDALTDSVQSLFSKNGNTEGTIHALDNVSFELKRGEILGIIGKNGAGKSTLLKILSEITEPTEGSVYFNGTVASILDIGTGFHDELTGSENIYLSGTMLGMSRQQIRDRYDQIVKFSGIGKFVNSPVKHYSNGMFIRLAFSVATHFDADILLLDEVLAVGDSGFSIKSFNKIKSLLKEGKTIIIVSHNLGSITNLCNKCLILEHGKVKAFGAPQELVDRYTEETLSELINQEQNNNLKESEEYLEKLQEELKDMQRAVEEKENALKSSTTQEKRLEEELQRARQELVSKTQEEEKRSKEMEAEKQGLVRNIIHTKSWANDDDAPESDFMRVKKIEVRGADKSADQDIYMSDKVVLQLDFEKHQPEAINLSFVLRYQLNTLAMGISTIIAEHVETINQSGSTGLIQASCEIPSGILNHGIFSIDIYAVNANNEIVFSADQILNFKVLLDPSRENDYAGTFAGPIFPQLNWKVSKKN